MGIQDTGKYITRPSVIILFLICMFIYYSLPARDVEEELDENEEIILRSTIKVPAGRYSEDGRSRNGRVEDDDEKAGGSKGTTPYDEVTIGDKRFRLYEKKRLNFKKADAYCRKQEGRLATTDSLSEMTKLQSLLARARTVTDDIWMGLYSKKAWKKHAWRDKPHPPGINPEALKGMSAMMMGGGREEMCPAMSSSTRASSPAQCYRQLAFICEFDVEPEPKPTPPPPTRPPVVKRKSNAKNDKTHSKSKTKSTTTSKNAKKQPNKNDKTRGKQKPKPKTTAKPQRKVTERTRPKPKTTTRPQKKANDKTRSQSKHPTSKPKSPTSKPTKKSNTQKPKLYRPQRRKVVVKDEM